MREHGYDRANRQYHCGYRCRPCCVFCATGGTDLLAVGGVNPGEF